MLNYELLNIRCSQRIRKCMYAKFYQYRAIGLKKRKITVRMSVSRLCRITSQT